MREAAQIVANLNTAASDTLVAQAAAASFTTDAGTNDLLIIFEVLPQSCFDLNNNTVGTGAFRFLGIETSASNGANVTAAYAILIPLRFPQQTPMAADV
jgi:hypothetical protein